ncbi:hypothetical protein BDQ17DRAFT_1548884 [Cyathus striatus]|nr:hypothetical protein BDQ17DRAFT_1548884 [Cyathus striatus]
MPKSTGSVSLSEITLASIFVESLLYGIFIVLFISSTTILLKKFGKITDRNVTRRLLFVSTLMFILGTIHISADLRRIFDAFITHKDDTEQYLNQVNTTIYLVKSLAYAMQTLVGDAFILYRLYLVWNGDKRVVYPVSICFIASICVAVGSLRALRLNSPTVPVFVRSLQQWIACFFSLTLMTNFSSTILIASRIWWTRRQTRQIQMGGRNLSPAAMVIIESGSIYSVCLVILLVLYISGNYATYIALDTAAQITGVVFSLVIVRVALGISSDAVISTRGGVVAYAPRDIEGRMGNDNHPQMARDNSIYSLKPLDIEVTTITDTL